MNKIVLFLLTFSGTLLYNAQNADNMLCGTEELMKKHYERHPEEKAKDDAFNIELSNMIKSGQLQAKLNKNNQVYEIPIVVHVVGDGSALGTAYNKSDADIIAWINYTNGVFSGNSSSGMYSGSSVLPVRFVFAKVAPNCTATTGINRIDASAMPKYVSGGVNSDNTTNAVAASDITALDMWDTSKYYNIYVVKKLASNAGSLNGFAYYPGGSLDYSFMSSSASSVNAQTLAHEFGHGLGLRHTHEGYNTTTGDCPSNTDCTVNGDLVCDTEPIKSLYHSSVPYTCQTGQINPCTNAIYAGGEKNIMSYTFCFRDRFTAGQTTRAIAQLLQYRQSLINSTVANAIIPNNNVTLVAACTPTTITTPGNYNIGITSVKFGSINNNSTNYKTASNNFYEDFTSNYCLGISKTEIQTGTGTTLTVASGTSNSHSIKVYIDYNNDGVFNETTENVLTQTGVTYATPATTIVTPPSNAVLNTPLRMRVIGDSNNTAITACYTPKYGQVEDYSVTILNTNLATFDIKGNQEYITKQDNNVMISSNQNISAIEIYDTSGKLLVNQSSIKSNKHSVAISEKNLIIIVNVTLANGKKLQQKLKF